MGLKYDNRLNRIFVMFLSLFFVVIVSAEKNNLIEQKILIEQNIQTRIESALEKILDDKFIVSVEANVSFPPLLIQKSVVQPNVSPKITASPNLTDDISQKDVFSTQQNYRLPWQTSNLPALVPQNPDEVQNEAEPTEEVTEEGTTTPEVLSQSYQQFVEQPPTINQLLIRVILSAATTQAATEEIVRWTIKEVIPGYSEARGDDIIIKTTTFNTKANNAVEEVLAFEVNKQMQDMRAMIENLEAELSLRDSLIYEIARNPAEAIEEETKNEAIRQTIQEKNDKYAELEARLNSIENQNKQLQEENAKLEQEKSDAILEFDKITQPTTSSAGLKSNKELLYVFIVLLSVLAIGILFLIIKKWGSKKTQAVQPEDTPTKSTKQNVPNSAVRAETESLRQHLVALSVGNPDTAKRIINDWLTDATTETNARSEEPEEKGEK